MIGFFTRSIPRQILAALLSIYVVTYGATAVVVYSNVRASILESDAAALTQLADLKYRQLANVIGSLATDLTAWSRLDVMNDLVSGDIDKRVAHTLEELKQLYDLSGHIYAFEAGGKLLASSDPDRESGEPIPQQWRTADGGVVLIAKGTDPMTGSQAIALAIPVFGRFDPTYRIGTLVLTYPWSSIEALLFSLQTGTVLVHKGDPPRILAASPADAVDRLGVDRISGRVGATEGAFVVGRSAPLSGLVADWQVVTLQASDALARPLRRVAIELVLLGASLGVPIVVLGLWLSRRMTAPIADLTSVASEIADTDRLDARAPVPGSEELGSLARSFNRMTDNLERATRERETYLQELTALNQTLEAKIAARTQELEAAMRAQQRLIGDISHEIKSPLARLSMALGLARRSADADRPKQFDRIEKEIDGISALASELLTLARLDEGAAAPPHFEQVDLVALVDAIIADAIFETPERASDVKFDRPEQPITIVGNAELLRRAIENVVRNAMFYTGVETGVEIAISRPAPDAVAVVIADHGPGVPDAALANLFEPFYRVDEARAQKTGGSGVGLAICQRVVQLHGGSVRARKVQPHGLAVDITLPLTPPTA